MNSALVKLSLLAILGATSISSALAAVNAPVCPRDMEKINLLDNNVKIEKKTINGVSRWQAKVTYSGLLWEQAQVNMFETNIESEEQAREKAMQILKSINGGQAVQVLQDAGSSYSFTCSYPIALEFAQEVDNAVLFSMDFFKENAATAVNSRSTKATPEQKLMLRR